MNNKVNSALVGMVVLVGLTLMLGFIYWMLKPQGIEEVKKYTIYFDESVLGLNVDAPVKYRGISVGKVIDLKINPKNTEQVEVTVSILNDTPIKTSTVAKLTAQGITGLSYINLNMGLNLAAPLEAKKGEKYPVVKTVPSFFENFENSLGSVSLQLASTLGRTQELLGTDNQEQISLVLKRTANVMQKMEQILDDETIAHLQNSVKNLDSFSRKLDKAMPNINRLIQNSVKWEDDIAHSFASIMTSYLGVKSSMAEIKRAISSGEFNVKAISADVVPTINATFLEMQDLMIQLGDVLEQYEKSPSDVLYKTQEIQKAPGEN